MPNSTLFICIDLQEKLLPLMAHKDELVKNANILLNAACILNIQTLISEQYPKGLGKTDANISVPQNAVVLEKTSFGIFDDETMKARIAKSGCKKLVFFGVESHICVLSSVNEALNLGYECILAADATSARNPTHHALALDALRQNGVKVLPSQSVLFSLLKSATHPKFKEISALIK